jgi:putative transcriptional regulator
METDFLDYARQLACRRMAGEIVLSSNIGVSLRKWRENFNLTQTSVARRMGVSASVVSDYETGRRRFPGVQFLRKFIDALTALDIQSGGEKILELARIEPVPSGVILSIEEFSMPAKASDIVTAVNGEVVACGEMIDRYVFGYTVVDSLKAILYFKGNEMIQLYGATNERAIVFTNVEHGRSPLVAIRMYPFKPRMIIMHGPTHIDPIAVELAKVERILTVISKSPTVKDLVQSLKDVELIAKLSDEKPAQPSP